MNTNRLEEVKAEFSAWRATRTSSKERIPENLWTAAASLLESYPLDIVCQQLKLKPHYLRKHAGILERKEKAPRKSKAEFLTLTADQLQTTELTLQGRSAQLKRPDCRIVIERTDGCRLSVSLPLEWAHIETLCTSFLRQ